MIAAIAMNVAAEKHQYHLTWKCRVEYDFSCARFLDQAETMNATCRSSKILGDDRYQQRPFLECFVA